MNKKLSTETSISIQAPAPAVWKALTTPSLIKKYLMGTNVSSDWKAGSAINYEGEYMGKKYHDKGVIKKIEPNKTLQSTYWSSAAGKEDKPENYNTVTYTLTEKGDKTQVTLSQDNIQSEKEKEQVTANWESVLQKLKEVIENTK
jgi:uncharacterized protein YndB with AHSA1/START domain